MNSVLTVQLDVNGVWRLGLFVGMALCLIYFLSTYIKKIGYIYTAFWGYVLLSALYLVEFPSTPYGNVNMAFMATAGQTLFEVLLIPIVMIGLTRYKLHILGILLSSLILVEFLFVNINGYGAMLSPSFDTSLLALAVPIAPFWLSALIILTIVTHHGSTAILILLAQLLALAIKNKKARYVLLAAIPAALTVAYFHSVSPMFDSAERINAYKKFMSFWWSQDLMVKLTGSGTGSFVWLSMMIDNFKPPMWLQMHSDWLQITFELGLIGLLLAVASVGQAIKNSWNHPKHLAAIFGCVAFAVTYHPLRFAPSMIMIAFIFTLSLKSKSHNR